MSCRAYNGIPNGHDEELRRTNDVKGMEILLNPNKKIRYVMPVKI